MSNAKQGGDLNDMAVDGTSIPGDAGKMNTIKSVPNPHQEAVTADGMGGPNAPSVADNPTDMPRNPRDMLAGNSDIITGTGDQMPGQTASKHTHYSGGNPLAKGSQRYDKHTRDNESTLDKGAAPTAEVVPAPGEENLTQDEIRDKKGL